MTESMEPLRLEESSGLGVRQSRGDVPECPAHAAVWPLEGRGCPTPRGSGRSRFPVGPPCTAKRSGEEKSFQRRAPPPSLEDPERSLEEEEGGGGVNSKEGQTSVPGLAFSRPYHCMSASSEYRGLSSRKQQSLKESLCQLSMC